jgi:hypothetical protein
MKRNSMRHHTFGIAGFIGLFFIMVATTRADQPSADAPLKIQKISLFKNGLAFFNGAVSLPSKATTVRIGQIPKPSFGTFWVGYSDKVKVKSLVSSLETVDDSERILSVGDLLANNIGRTVTIRTGSTDKDFCEGTILEIRSAPEDKDLPNPYFMDVHRGSNSYNQYYGDRSKPGFVLVKSGKGITAISIASIVKADIAGSDINYIATAKVKKPSIRIELAQPAGGETVGISLLAKGITWAPSYCIDLSDPKTAKLSAKATVMNEVMDFDKVSCELVTGFPNIAFSEVVGPESMSEKLADFLGSLSRGRSETGNRSRNQMMQQQAVLGNMAGGGGDDFALPAYSTPEKGTNAEDLFLYPVKEFSLKKGETATLPLFSAAMPYKHLYTWDIEDLVDNSEQYQYNSRSHSDRPPEEEIWHSCRLTNTLSMPLTTAAAEFTSDGAFIGQDLCYYTAPGVETTIKITRALNVKAEQAEVELDRKREAALFYNYRYDLVKVRGDMKVKNLLNKPITLEIKKHLTGEIIQKSAEAKDVPTAKGLKQVNPRHVLSWQLSLSPGEEKSVTYIYQVYIHN